MEVWPTRAAGPLATAGLVATSLVMMGATRGAPDLDHGNFRLGGGFNSGGFGRLGARIGGRGWLGRGAAFESSGWLLDDRRLDNRFRRGCLDRHRLGGDRLGGDRLGDRFGFNGFGRRFVASGRVDASGGFGNGLAFGGGLGLG